MLEWRTPESEDIGLLRKYMDEAGAVSSDSSPVNIYLLREKYNIRIAEADGFLFRRYTGEGLPGRDGFTLPLGKGDTVKALELLKQDCRQRKKPLKLIYLTDAACGELKEGCLCPDLLTDRGNSDYLYTAEHLAVLPGRDNHRKRNRAKRFERLYPDYRFVCREDRDGKFCEDIITVEERWFSDQEERIDSAFVEREEIYEACRKWDDLGLIGAILYADDIPVAMSIASRISGGCYDIHFEKCYGEYAQAGGFACINRDLARHLMSEYGAEWINREEDIGIEGLRKAKMSYNPDRLLTKYHCCIRI